MDIEHGNNENQPDTLSIGNRPVQIVKIEDSTQPKWVKLFLFLFIHYPGFSDSVWERV